jgi:Molybdopterin-binding domain of aldehyde dehydrogenase
VPKRPPTHAASEDRSYGQNENSVSADKVQSEKQQSEKTGDSSSRSGVSRRSFLGWGVAGVAAVSGPWLRVADAQQGSVASSSTAPQSTEAVPMVLKINGQEHRVSLEPRVTLPEILRLRVSRWLSVVDGGRMINAKTARNQILGAVVMGIGMGMLEETVYDARTGHPINNNFADYLVAVNADVPELDCIFLDYPDPVINEYGARGIGEIGLTGCASALTMATYHATGVRIRELPIRIEKLMAGLEKSSSAASRG